MYYKRNIDGKSGFLLVLVEVDDLVITGDERLVNNLRQNLLKEYSITQFEPINSFLGINIKYDSKASPKKPTLMAHVRPYPVANQVRTGDSIPENTLITYLYACNNTLFRNVLNAQGEPMFSPRALLVENYYEYVKTLPKEGAR